MRREEQQPKRKGKDNEKIVRRRSGGSQIGKK